MLLEEVPGHGLVRREPAQGTEAEADRGRGDTVRNAVDLYRVLRFYGGDRPIIQGETARFADARRMARESIRAMTEEIPVWCGSTCWHPHEDAPGRIPVGGYDIESSYKAAVIYKKVS
jgi:hypothetical protein